MGFLDGLFGRKIKQGSDLTSFPTDRLMQEYHRTQLSFSYVAETNAAAEFSEPGNRPVVDGQRLLAAINDGVLGQELRDELRRRGFDVE